MKVIQMGFRRRKSAEFIWCWSKLRQKVINLKERLILLRGLFFRGIMLMIRALFYIQSSIDKSRLVKIYLSNTFFKIRLTLIIKLILEIMLLLILKIIILGLYLEFLCLNLLYHNSVSFLITNHIFDFIYINYKRAHNNYISFII